ncbi:ATP/GTP-binding protein [Candidatus Micrarchaeota archaeon]|nr:ATP/GTP-binding protein [Candidatus Micrarchaeota archaeon]
MNRILVCGPHAVGKSLLVYTFSKYLQHKGVSVKTVHLDPAAKRLSFVPDLDVRHFFRGTDSEETVQKAVRDKTFQDEVSSFKADVVLLDAPSGLDWFLFSRLPRFCDEAWLVTAEPVTASLAKAVSDALGVDALNVVNQRQRLTGQQKTLSLFSLQTPRQSHGVFVNAWEREGFVELHQLALRKG